LTDLRIDGSPRSSGQRDSGRYLLRLAIGQMRTTEDDVRWACDMLKREAAPR
jgi:hypothetical protein